MHETTSTQTKETHRASEMKTTLQNCQHSNKATPTQTEQECNTLRKLTTTTQHHTGSTNSKA